MIKIDSHIKPPRVRKPRKHPQNVQEAFTAYSVAYKRVYGVSPSGFTYDKLTGFIHIGNRGRIGWISNGVSLGRLKELTRQLTFQAGV